MRWREDAELCVCEGGWVVEVCGSDVWLCTHWHSRGGSTAVPWSGMCCALWCVGTEVATVVAAPLNGGRHDGALAASWVLRMVWWQSLHTVLCGCGRRHDTVRVCGVCGRRCSVCGGVLCDAVRDVAAAAAAVVVVV